MLIIGQYQSLSLQAQSSAVVANEMLYLKEVASILRKNILLQEIHTSSSLNPIAKYYKIPLMIKPPTLNRPIFLTEASHP